MKYFACTWIIQGCNLGAVHESFFVAKELGCHQILLDIPLDWWEISGLISVDIAIQVPSLEMFEEYKNRTAYRTRLISWKLITVSNYEEALAQDFNQENTRREKYAKTFYYYANINKIRRIDDELESIPVTQLNMDISKVEIEFFERNNIQSLAKMLHNFYIVANHDKYLWQRIFIQMQEDGYYNLENLSIIPNNEDILRENDLFTPTLQAYPPSQRLSVRQVKSVAEKQADFSYDYFSNGRYWDICVQIEDNYALMHTNIYDGDDNAPLRYFMLCGDLKAIKVLVQQIANHYGTYLCYFGPKAEPLIFIPDK